MEVSGGHLQVSYSSRGTPTYALELWHPGLKKHRLVKGGDAVVVQRKAQLQTDEWDEQWEHVVQRERRIKDQHHRKLQADANKEIAAQRSREAQEELSLLRSTLAHTLAINDVVDWDSLQDHSPFPVPRPTPPALPPAAQPDSMPQEPRRSDPDFQPQLGLLDKLFASRRQKKISEAYERFSAAHRAWEQMCEDTVRRNELWISTFRAAIATVNERYAEAINLWENKRSEFMSEQRSRNDAIVRQKDKYLSGASEVVGDHCDLVLTNSAYPQYFPKEYELDYNPENKLLIVEYSLPTLESIPTTSDVRYVPARDEFTEKRLPESTVAKLYDDVLYQTTLRTVHELFESDVVFALDTIVFNGWVRSVDKRTGQDVNACILSLRTRREEFTRINLGSVDPKACFKALKGVGSSKLHSMAAIPPIQQIRREDGRFVAAQAIAHQLDDSYNLAAMPWEDFEHLIRELFEQEFATAGGEVKVTRASRDGGVDAVVFDPDPIRGGKIVIQAKRYTNTVGVSAVRDLYGTLLNEGASKGILVTTSDYGPDAYQFATGKPLTLLNGANLLHLLEKHGRKARIDLQEARSLGLSSGTT